MFLSSEIEISKKEVANITVFVISLHNKQIMLRVELHYVNEYLLTNLHNLIVSQKKL